LNDKILIDSDSHYKKSNELSTARMMQGLDINQMRLLAYAIHKTQHNEVSFSKAEFEKRFNLENYLPKLAVNDALELFKLIYQTYDPKENETTVIHVFNKMQYGYNKDGLFKFEWHEELLPHILDLKERFVLIDLGVASQFKSSFTWIFYEFIKGNYGKHYIELSKDELMKLFNVHDVKSYQHNTGQFKAYVIDKAISEINEFTEYWVEYDEVKRGRKIIGFRFKFRKTKPYVKKATDKQLSYMNTQFDNLRLNYSMDLLDMRHKDLQEKARDTLKAIISKEIALPKEVSSDQADEFIKEINKAIKGIEALIKLDKETPLNTDIPEFEPFHVPEFDWNRFK
jgi:plasmid replication initiation protein